MSKNKKFFWLKLKEDFFESDEIKILESLPNGMVYSNFYLKLLCKSIKNNGVLRLRNVIPYTVEMLSSMTNTNIDIARGAIEKLIALNMIEVLDDGALYMLDIENMIGSETDSAQRMRDARAKKINLEEKDKKSVTLCENVRKSDTEIDTENSIKDSGERRIFATGAVRDMSEGKGRFDLLPLDVLGVANQDNRLTNISNYQKTNDPTYLYAAMSAINYRMDYELIARIARHFENGAKKYDENNWRKGLPCKCYIDSAVRHYFKWVLGEIDEDHESAFYWNIMCCIWTHENAPEMQSYKK